MSPSFSKKQKIRFFCSVRGFIVLAVVVMACSDLLPGQAPESPHFRSSRHEGNVVAYFDHFRFPEHQFIFRAPDSYTPIFDQGNILATFLNRTNGCSIEVRQSRLNQVPKDEKAALELYESRVKDLASPNFVKDARVRDVNELGWFPQTYILSTTEKDPPVRMMTYLVIPPYLYEIEMNVKGRMDGKVRTDYGQVCSSIAIEKPAGAGPSGVSNPEASSPSRTPESGAATPAVPTEFPMSPIDPSDRKEK